MKKQRQFEKHLSGFSIIELLVALAVFLILGAASIRLIHQHVPLLTAQNTQSGLNLTMRNAIAQLQQDVVNAGADYYPTINIPTGAVGITVQNNVPPQGQSCYQNGVYTATCFDALYIITFDTSTPPANPIPAGNGSVACQYTDRSSTLFAQPASGSNMTAPQLAALYHAGDNLLLIQGSGQSTNAQMAMITLTKDGSISGGKIHLDHNPTGANTTSGTTLGDPFMINQDNKLGNSFCSSDWILKLGPPIIYSVDNSNPADPQLKRQQNGQIDVIADQIIGLKIGASVWNNTSDTPYLFNATQPLPQQSDPNSTCTSNCGYGSDWGAIRTLYISIIARTTPNVGNYVNNFDGGRYMIQAMSVAINPRNLSLNDR